MPLCAAPPACRIRSSSKAATSRANIFPTTQRLFADLDFVLQPHYDDPHAAAALLTQWMQAVTTLHYPDDGVQFVPFAENVFWDNVDYAMADDFPTVNTDFDCRIEGWECDGNVDVSLNL